MRYPKSLVMFILIIALLAIVRVHGEEEGEEEGMEYEVDSNGYVISSKKVKMGEEDNENDNKINPNIELPEEDIGIPVEMEEENSGKSEKVVVTNNEDNKKEVQNEEVKKEEENKDDNQEVVEEKDQGQEANNEEEKAEEENDQKEEDTKYIEVEIVMDESVIVAENRDFKSYFEEGGRMVVGCFDSLTNTDYLNFRNTSNIMLGTTDIDPFRTDILKFIVNTDSQCRNIVKRYTGLTIFKNDIVYCVLKRCFEYPPQDIEDVEKLKEFIEDKEIPYISEYIPERADFYKQLNIPALVYINNDEEETEQNIGNFLSGIAEENENKFIFLVTNHDKFNMKTLDEPRDHNVLIFAPEFQTLYSIQEILESGDAINEVSIRSFIKQYEKGVLTPRLIPQDFEKDWDYENFVVKSVPRYYYPHVLNPTRDSLVLFYKTDCPYSQEAVKSFEKLGKRYANYRTKFSVVKFEAEEQRIPKMSIWRKLEAYPTIVLFKANPYSRVKKEFIVYPDDAGRSAVTLDKWVQIHSFYKPTPIFSEDDYKEQKIMDADYLDVNEKEEEEKEERIQKYLEDPKLIFTRFGHGKDSQIDEQSDDEDSGKEEAEYFFDNINTSTEIPMTGTYYELTSTTYVVKTSYYTPPPSIYDDDEEVVVEEEVIEYVD